MAGGAIPVALGITPKDKCPDDCSIDGQECVPHYIKAQYGSQLWLRIRGENTRQEEASGIIRSIVMVVVNDDVVVIVVRISFTCSLTVSYISPMYLDHAQPNTPPPSAPSSILTSSHGLSRPPLFFLF